MQRYFAINQNLELDQNDIHHIINVMRMKLNEKFIILYDNIENECIIDSINKKDLTYSVVKSTKIEINKNYKVTLAISLIKEQKLDYVLQKSTELGVDEIILLNTNRSIIKINDVESKIKRYNRICKEASEQSHRSNVPVINGILNISELTENKSDLKLLCTVNEVSTNIKEILHKSNNYGTLLIVIGPEGGFSSTEEQILIKNGFISVSLGNNVLRAETAPLYILSVINYEFLR